MEYVVECPDKDFDLILTEYKEIPLSQGKVALVDVEDYDYLSKSKWCVEKTNNNVYYATKNWSKGIKMHNAIMRTKKGEQVDHRNHNGLDCRRSNLRTCTSAQNARNRRISSRNTSGYKGVSYVKSRNCWVACIHINSKNKNLGYFINKEEAALAYNEAAIKYYKEFANINHIV